MATALGNAQKRYLRGLAHDLKPVLLVGAKGITDNLVAEADGALAHHELVKVRVVADDRELRDEWIAELGRTGTSRDMLHFEVRRNGKPVDPLGVLPRN